MPHLLQQRGPAVDDARPPGEQQQQVELLPGQLDLRAAHGEPSPLRIERQAAGADHAAAGRFAAPAGRDAG